MGIAAYTAGTPLLAPATVNAGTLFLNDELAHASALGALIKAAGAEPVSRRRATTSVIRATARRC